MNKKGIFFTITAIALLTLSLVSFSIYETTKTRTSITKRITTLNNFIVSLEEDLSRKLYISGFRTIFLFEKRILESGEYITTPETTIEEAIINGTIEGRIQEDEEALIEGVTFTDIQEDITTLANKLNLKVNMTNPQLTITQEDPWNIKITLTTNMNIQDKGKLAEWNKTLETNTYIPIEGFEDPIYLIETNGKIFQKINRTPYNTLVNGTDVSNLEEHLTNSYYIATNKSPNFLQRLAGNLSGGEQGIESLVYLPALATQGISIKDKSAADSTYFSTENPVSYNIQGMPDWFKIEDERLELYNLTGLTV